MNKLTISEAAEMSHNVSTRFRGLEKDGITFDENEIIDGLIFLLGQSVKLNMDLETAMRARLDHHRRHGKEAS